MGVGSIIKDVAESEPLMSLAKLAGTVIVALIAIFIFFAFFGFFFIPLVLVGIVVLVMIQPKFREDLTAGQALLWIMLAFGFGMVATFVKNVAHMNIVNPLIEVCVGSCTNPPNPIPPVQVDNLVYVAIAGVITLLAIAFVYKRYDS